MRLHRAAGKNKDGGYDDNGIRAEDLRVLGHDEEGGGAGAEVIGDSECPEGGGEEEAVAGWREGLVLWHGG
jgi:hypothetical protein